MAMLNERLSDFLAKKGRKLTVLMARVVDAVLSSPGTFSAAEISENLRGEVSRPTVFRTLRWLEKADLIRQVPFNGQTVFVLTANEL